jgi:polyisoprenoid-binding protein YceI
MFKYLFPVLLFPLILIGAGCAQQEVADESDIAAELIEETFEDGSYSLESEASVAWDASMKVGGSHNGEVSITEGALLVEGGTVIGGSFVVDMDSITDLDLTDEKLNASLVGHLKSDDFFAVATYPTATFALSEVVFLEGIEGATHRLTGMMTIKGIENEITFPAMLGTSDDQISLSAVVELDRTLWDVRYGSGKFFEDLGDSVINDEFTLTMDLNFVEIQEGVDSISDEEFNKIGEIIKEIEEGLEGESAE